MGEALVAAAGEAGIRITLLDACYLQGGIGQPLQGTQLRFGDGDAVAWAERAAGLRTHRHRPRRRGDPLGAGRAGRPARSDNGVGPRAGGRVARRTCRSSAPRTRSACRPPARTPTQVLDDAGALGAAVDRGARHAPHRRRHRAARWLGDDDLPVPDDRARPGGRHRSGARAGSRRLAAVAGQRQPRRRRPARGGPRRRAGRAAGVAVSAATSRPRTCCGRRPRTGTRQPGLARGRDADGRCTGRLRDGRAGRRSGSPGSDPATLLESVVFAATAADVRELVVAGRRVVAGGPARPGRRRAGCAGVLDRGGAAMTDLVVDHIGTPGHERPGGRRRAARAGPRRRAGRARRRGRLGRAAQPRHPRAQRGTAVDAGGRAVLPGFVDSHGHLVFAGDRTEEFAARMSGTPYTAGGIRTTVEATRAASDDAAGRGTAPRWSRRPLRSGTTTTRVQVGLRPHRARRAAQPGASPREQTAELTFLGAHVVPPEYAGRSDDYVDLVCTTMLAACAPAARWVDVFCERGAFDADQARAVLQARGRGRPGAPGARQPARPRTGSAAGGRARRGLRRPLSRTSRPTTSRRWPPAAPSPPCCPGRSSRPAPPTPTPGGCSTPASPSRSRRTATPAPASPPTCRSASRSRCGRWG